MSRKTAQVPPPAVNPEHGTAPVPPHPETHHDVSSPAAVHANDRKKLATKRNDAQPLSHRDRGKAGRKG
jgi:hypothetical protein